MSPRMVQWIHATLRNALHHAFSEELVTRNVARGVRIETPEKVTAIEPFTVDEARTSFLRRVRDHRLYALWVVVLMLGLRRSEVRGLHWSDVDLDRATLRVRRGLQRVGDSLQELPTKTLRSHRTVPLPAFCVHVLTEHRERQGKERADPAAAGSTRRTFHLVRWHAARTADAHPDFPRAVRAPRHAPGPAARPSTQLREPAFALGVSPRIVMEIVGHSAIEMIMNVYAYVSLGNQRAALDLLNVQLVDDGGDDE